jgi:hypothetical protein
MLANRIVEGWVLTERHLAQDAIAILYATGIYRLLRVIVQCAPKFIQRWWGQENMVFARPQLGQGHEDKGFRSSSLLVMRDMTIRIAFRTLPSFLQPVVA